MCSSIFRIYSFNSAFGIPGLNWSDYCKWRWMQMLESKLNVVKLQLATIREKKKNDSTVASCANVSARTGSDRFLFGVTLGTIIYLRYVASVSFGYLSKQYTSSKLYSGYRSLTRLMWCCFIFLCYFPLLRSSIFRSFINRWCWLCGMFSLRAGFVLVPTC